LVVVFLLGTAPVASAAGYHHRNDHQVAKSERFFYVASVRRIRHATHYKWKADRLGDNPGGFEPDAFRDAIAVNVSVSDAIPERVNDFGEPETLTLYLDPSSLSPSQQQALSDSSVTSRAAAFDVSTRRVTRTVQRIDYRHSILCDSDTLRCNEHLVYETVTIEDVEPVLS
jgi:hypothetical protein